MAGGISKQTLHKGMAHEFQAGHNLPILLQFYVKSFHIRACIRLRNAFLYRAALGILFAGAFERVDMSIRDVMGLSDERGQIFKIGKGFFGNYWGGYDGATLEHGVSTVGVQKNSAFTVIDVEFQKVVRQRVIVDGMLGEHPFAVHDIACSQQVKQHIDVNVRPFLEEVVVFFTGTADKVMTAALKQKRPVVVKRYSRIGSVAFLLDNQFLSCNFRERDLGQVFVTGLQT